MVDNYKVQNFTINYETVSNISFSNPQESPTKKQRTSAKNDEKGKNKRFVSITLLFVSTLTI